MVRDGTLTGGAYCVAEVSLPARTAIPPHTRVGEDAFVFVLTGELDVICGADHAALGPGGHAVLPRSAPCRLLARADVQLLCLFTPAGIEGLADLATIEPSADADDIAARLAAAGISLLPANWRPIVTAER